MGNSIKNPEDFDVVRTFKKEDWVKVDKSNNHEIWQNQISHLLADVYFISKDLKPSDLQHYQLRRNNSANLVKVYHVGLEKNKNLCSASNDAAILTQRIILRLNTLKRLLSFNEGLTVLKAAYSGFNTLCSFYGPIEPYQDMICFNKEGKPKVWLNSNLSVNDPEQKENLTKKQDRSNRMPIYIGKLLDMVENKVQGQHNFRPIVDEFRSKQPKTYFEAINIIQEYISQHHLPHSECINIQTHLNQQKQQNVKHSILVESPQHPSVHNQQSFSNSRVHHLSPQPVVVKRSMIREEARHQSPPPPQNTLFKYLAPVPMISGNVKCNFVYNSPIQRSLSGGTMDRKMMMYNKPLTPHQPSNLIHGSSFESGSKVRGEQMILRSGVRKGIEAVQIKPSTNLIHESRQVTTLIKSQIQTQQMKPQPLKQTIHAQQPVDQLKKQQVYELKQKQDFEGSNQQIIQALINQEENYVKELNSQLQQQQYKQQKQEQQLYNQQQYEQQYLQHENKEEQINYNNLLVRNLIERQSIESKEQQYLQQEFNFNQKQNAQAQSYEGQQAHQYQQQQGQRQQHYYNQQSQDGLQRRQEQVQGQQLQQHNFQNLNMQNGTQGIFQQQSNKQQQSDNDNYIFQRAAQKKLSIERVLSRNENQRQKLVQVPTNSVAQRISDDAKYQDIEAYIKQKYSSYISEQIQNQSPTAINYRPQPYNNVQKMAWYVQSKYDQMQASKSVKQIELENAVKNSDNQRISDMLDVKNMERSLDKKYNSVKSQPKIELEEEGDEQGIEFDVKKLEQNLIKFEESRVGNAQNNNFSISDVSKIGSSIDRLNQRKSSLNFKQENSYTYIADQKERESIVQNYQPPALPPKPFKRKSKVYNHLGSIDQKFQKYVGNQDSRKHTNTYSRNTTSNQDSKKTIHKYYSKNSLNEDPNYNEMEYKFQEPQNEYISSRIATGKFEYADFEDNNRRSKMDYNKKSGIEDYNKRSGTDFNKRSGIEDYNRRSGMEMKVNSNAGISYEDLRKYMWS